MQRERSLFTLLSLDIQPDDKKDSKEDEKKKNNSPRIPRKLATAPLKSQ
jgi:hypothetical protein